MTIDLFWPDAPPPPPAPPPMMPTDTAARTWGGWAAAKAHALQSCGLAEWLQQGPITNDHKADVHRYVRPIAEAIEAYDLVGAEMAFYTLLDFMSRYAVPGAEPFDCSVAVSEWMT